MNRKDYLDFIDLFSKRLNELEPGISFYYYGSLLREDFNEYVSDLDGFLVFNDEFVTNKNKLMNISKILAQIKKDGLKSQFNLLDVGTGKDGRFMSYDATYVDSFKNGGVKKVFGEFNLQDLRSFNYRHPELVSIAHNLYKIRQSFLEYHTNLNAGKTGKIERALSFPPEKLYQLPKQLIHARTGSLIVRKKEGLETFLNFFPSYDGSFALKNSSIRLDKRKYLEISKNPAENLDYSLRCLSEMENMIKVYVDRFPDINSVEVRD